MNIVLVHGAGGTPVTWTEVAPLLRDAGHDVVAVTNPMTSLEDDVANTVEAIRSFGGGPVVLVGHSYGGAVITNAGREPGVKALVYVAAFAPDEGETVNGIVEKYPPAEVSKFMRRGPDGEWSSEHTEEYYAEIAWDLAPSQRRAWDEESRQVSNLIYTQATGVPAWRTVPAYYLVAADDKTLRPEIQRDMSSHAGMTVEEIEGSHFTTRVHPGAVVAFIEKAIAA
ncbi:alpha/beta fold hydrolase [Actinoplanes sp. RD1]|uniref:alpha/beta fold hydrolase n=1 Tax=Actinoplanes sp. RD1 TaxID=3064538 RepID=UPI002741F702|nr:alpha/beta fold hydrolase [Actinoplanes sp. RD1]